MSVLAMKLMSLWSTEAVSIEVKGETARERYRCSRSLLQDNCFLLYCKDHTVPPLLILLPYRENKFSLLSVKSMKEAILSQNMTNPLAFIRRILFRSILFSPICSRICSLVTFSDNLIFSIFLQHYISKLVKYLRFNFLSVQVSEPYKAILFRS